MPTTAKLKIGSPATGLNFYPRATLRRSLVRALERDHQAFLGPRRTGKTSILKDLEKNPPPGFFAVYLDLQGLRSVPVWLDLMLKATRTLLQTPSEQLQWLKKLGKDTGSLIKRIEGLGPTGIKLTPGQPAVEQWEPLANDFLALLQEKKVPVIFMLDEFPWFLGHVAAFHTAAEVDATLNWFRKARQALSDCPTRFLVTGSIGLAGLLRRLGLSPAANDFDVIDIEPLTNEEALQFLEERAEGEGIVLSAAARRRILERLGVGWPILLATFLSEIQEDGDRHPSAKGPTVKDIDRLYEDRLVRGNRNKYCQEMFTRLTKPELFSPSERRLALEILRTLCRSEEGFGRAEFEAVHQRLVPDASHRDLISAELDAVIDTLRHDGYLVRLRDADPTRDGRHHFASHILRDFWRHHTA
jgi:uncharacterized protein